jgi:hypothetical protein
MRVCVSTYFFSDIASAIVYPNARVTNEVRMEVGNIKVVGRLNAPCLRYKLNPCDPTILPQDDVTDSEILSCDPI